jgi:hypothetical protein
MGFNPSDFLNPFYLVSTRAVILNHNSFFVPPGGLSQSMYFEIHNRVWKWHSIYSGMIFTVGRILIGFVLDTSPIISVIITKLK